MARYSSGARSTGPGTNLLPTLSLYAAAAVGGRIRELGLFNTTAVACAVALYRLTTAGTSNAISSVGKHDPASAAASCTPRDTHTSTGPTVGDNLGYRASLGAAIGSGVIWTFGDSGLLIPVGTANGIGIIVPTGTGQILDWWVTWDE